jgi:phosphoglycerol transferase
MSEAQLLTAPDKQSEPAARSHRRMRDYLLSVAVYVGTSLLCLLLVCQVMKLWHADLSVPLYYGHDATAVLAGVKNLVENGDWNTNKFLGAPGQLETYDFPSFGFNHFLALSLLALCSSDYVLVLNLYFLLSFPLSAVTSLFVLRRFRVSYPAAILASLLFAFAPYHFLRGGYHYFLALYYLVPLVVMVALWVGRGDPLFRLKCAPGQWCVSRKGAAALAICALMTLDSVYYAFFGAWLLIVAALFARIRNGRRGALPSTAVLLSVVVLTLFIALRPSFNYVRHHGRNPSVAVRSPSESEFYGLKMTQLVLPVTGHRVPALARLKSRYNSAPLVNENDFASLGMIASCGFILLLSWAAFGRGLGSAELLSSLSALNLGAFLLGTIGGVGSLFALLISPGIRSLNRISIFIAFLSLFAIALLVDHVGQRLRGRVGAVAWYGGLAVLLMVGMFDQTTRDFVPQHQAMKEQFDNHAEFVHRVEKSLPANAMIFQLPYMSFPENVPIHKLSDYDHLLGYLHSKTLRWSYPAIRGRETDAWVREVAGKPVPQMVDALALAGFGGIYVDRRGYQDNADSLESQLRQTLGVEPILGDESRLLFFDLRTTQARLRSKYTSAEWQALHDAALALPPVSVTWEPSCWPLEGTPDNNWRWCPDYGNWYVTNRSQEPKRVTFEMTLSTGYKDTAGVQMVTPWITKDTNTNSDGAPLKLSLTIPPGESAFEFNSNAKLVHAPSDLKSMFFRVQNFHFTVSP